jgi:tRNA (uracil-5-)-methyltransferase TRM9
MKVMREIDRRNAQTQESGYEGLLSGFFDSFPEDNKRQWRQRWTKLWKSDQKPTEYADSKDATRELYCIYYSSGLYDDRYPGPNKFVLRLLSAIAQGGKILDFGCGSGRYSFALSRHSQSIVAYDPCPKAIERLRARREELGAIFPTTQCEDVREKGPYDLALALFGVIAHIPNKNERLDTLRFIKSALSDRGLLVISVPNRFRRFYVEQLKVLPRRDDPIYYRRGPIKKLFPYLLYTTRSLSQELEASGFSVITLLPESILPETVVTQWPLVANCERLILQFLCKWRAMRSLLASLGYGLLAVARPK